MADRHLVASRAVSMNPVAISACRPAAAAAVAARHAIPAAYDDVGRLLPTRSSISRCHVAGVRLAVNQTSGLRGLTTDDVWAGPARKGAEPDPGVEVAEITATASPSPQEPPA